MRAAVLLVEARWKETGWRYPEGQGVGERVLKVMQWESCGAVTGLACMVV